MAFVAQGGGGYLTPGAQQYAERYPITNTGAPRPSAQTQQIDPFDAWERHFQRSTTFVPGRTGSDELSGAYIYRNKRAIEENKRLGEDKRRLAALARKIGVDTTSPGALGILWMDAVDEARAAGMVDPGIANLDRGPWEILEAWAANGSYEGAAKGAKSRAGTFTQTQKNVNLTDPQTARAVIMEALHARLQRDPTDAEVAAFTAALKGTEEKNPSVTTTTATYDEEGNLVTSDTETAGGAPAPGAFAENWLTEERDAEADAIRAGQDYFDVARQLATAVV